MRDHKARVRKLVTRFNTLSDDGKDMILEQMEALKQGKRIIPGTQGVAVDVLDLICRPNRRTGDGLYRT